MLGKNDVVLVTGATGFTGSVLVRQLCLLGCKVKAIARHSSTIDHLSDLPIEWFRGEVYDNDVVVRAMENVDYVFHVAAAYREAGIEDRIYQLVHVESTKLIAAAAKSQAKFKRMIHVSTVGVLGHIKKPPADEATAYGPGDVYQNTKAEAERWIIDFAKEHDFPVSIVRPAAIYGPGDRRLLKLFKMARMPIVPLIGFSRGLYHLIHVDDLVGFLVHVADRQDTLGEIYICGSNEPISIKSMIEVIAKKIGRRPLFVRVPAWPVFLLADICEAVCKPLNVEPPIYRRRIAFFTKDRAFATAKMQSVGYQPANSDEKGLADLCDWYHEKGWL